MGSLENAQEWREAARVRRELFELEIPEEELRMVAKCACGASQPPVRCGRCKVVFYCGPDCQKKAWPVHKHECQPPDEVTRRAKSVRECPVCLQEIDLSRGTEDNLASITILACPHAIHRACWDSFAESRAEVGNGI